MKARHRAAEWCYLLWHRRPRNFENAAADTVTTGDDTGNYHRRSGGHTKKCICRGNIRNAVNIPALSRQHMRGFSSVYTHPLAKPARGRSVPPRHACCYRLSLIIAAGHGHIVGMSRLKDFTVGGAQNLFEIEAGIDKGLMTITISSDHG